MESSKKQSVELSENLEKLIDIAVSNGIFKSKTDAITEILEKAFVDGVVNGILKTKMEGFSKLMQEMKAFEDMKKSLAEDGKEKRVERSR